MEDRLSLCSSFFSRKLTRQTFCVPFHFGFQKSSTQKLSFSAFSADFLPDKASTFIFNFCCGGRLSAWQSFYFHLEVLLSEQTSFMTELLLTICFRRWRHRYSDWARTLKEQADWQSNIIWFISQVSKRAFIEPATEHDPWKSKTIDWWSQSA